MAEDGYSSDEFWDALPKYDTIDTLVEYAYCGADLGGYSL